MTTGTGNRLMHSPFSCKIVNMTKNITTNIVTVFCLENKFEGPKTYLHTTKNILLDSISQGKNGSITPGVHIISMDDIITLENGAGQTGKNVELAIFGGGPLKLGSIEFDSKYFIATPTVIPVNTYRLVHPNFCGDCTVEISVSSVNNISSINIADTGSSVFNEGDIMKISNYELFVAGGSQHDEIKGYLEVKLKSSYIHGTQITGINVTNFGINYQKSNKLNITKSKIPGRTVNDSDLIIELEDEDIDTVYEYAFISGTNITSFDGRTFRVDSGTIGAYGTFTLCENCDTTSYPYP